MLTHAREQGLSTDAVSILGVPDRYVEHGKVAELNRQCGLDDASVLARLRAMIRPE
jgi:deoxyxylulose-5-phosphate synthase